MDAARIHVKRAQTKSAPRVVMAIGQVVIRQTCTIPGRSNSAATGGEATPSSPRISDITQPHSAPVTHVKSEIEWWVDVGGVVAFTVMSVNGVVGAEVLDLGQVR